MSRREYIISAIQRALSQVFAPGESRPVEIMRDSQQVIARSARFALVVDWQREQARRQTNMRDECDLEVGISAMMKCNDRDDAALDELVTAVHDALMSDRTFGGLALETEYRGAARDTVYDGEGAINEIRHVYSVRYQRTSVQL